MKNYVIIGNSIAATGAVEGIRSVDREGSITIVTDEETAAYSRPLISYLLLGKTTWEKMAYREPDFYDKNGCKVIKGRAAKIDASKKTVLLEDGSTIEYGALLCATGSRPFVPPVKGLDTVKKKFTFFGISDARALEKAVSKKTKVLIVGAGLIGLKCAEGIYERAGGITVIDLAPKALSSILDDDASAMVKSHLESRGIKLMLSESVKEFSESTALLESGKKLGFDVLVMAVGVRPETGLVKDAGGAAGRGITINERCETSLRDIYAAGDCTESMDVSSGQIRIMALLPNAYMQGECAGINMAGGDAEFTNAIPLNSIGLFGMRIMTAGSYTGNTYTGSGSGYKKLFYEDDVLKGFILIDNTDKAGIYTSLIRERTPLSSIDFGLVCSDPGLMAFTARYREDKLGGNAR